jgi:APA family basic amino acid/polyamine antiporter
VTAITGVFVTLAAAFLPVGRLADISNSGTLFAFMMVAVGVMVLRVRDPGRHRSFRAPGIWVVGPLAVLGCLYLFFSLPWATTAMFFIWAALGLAVYALYGYRRSALARQPAG